MFTPDEECKELLEKISENTDEIKDILEKIKEILVFVVAAYVILALSAKCAS